MPAIQRQVRDPVETFSLGRMLRLSLKVSDLASLRFARSPLQETVISLWIWQNPTRYAIHQPLVKASAHHLRHLDWELLQALVGPGGFLADFLTPLPSTPRPDMEDELALLRATPEETVVSGLVGSANGRPLHPRLRGVHDDPPGLVAEIADALKAYWDLVLAPHWPRMRAVLETDVLYRAKQLADGGAHGLFAEVDRGLTWDGGVLTVDEPGLDLDVPVEGRGLTFTPSLFCNRAVTLVDPTLPPRIWYPARGRGTVWEADPGTSSEALAELLGKTRAQLLANLEEPTSTTDLARLLGLSAGAVSQHLGVLHRTGLVLKARHGHRVLYSRSPIGQRLMS